MAAFFGDLERLIADLFPYRWPITAGVLVVLAALAAVGYRRGWHTVIWRKRVPVAILGTPMLVLAVIAGWYLVSPLFIDKRVEEEFPFALNAIVPADMDRLEVEKVMAGIAKMDQEDVDEKMPAFVSLTQPIAVGKTAAEEAAVRAADARAAAEEAAAAKAATERAAAKLAVMVAAEEAAARAAAEEAIAKAAAEEAIAKAAAEEAAAAKAAAEEAIAKAAAEEAAAKAAAQEAAKAGAEGAAARAAAEEAAARAAAEKEAAKAAAARAATAKAAAEEAAAKAAAEEAAARAAAEEAAAKAAAEEATAKAAAEEAAAAKAAAEEATRVAAEEAAARAAAQEAAAKAAAEEAARVAAEEAAARAAAEEAAKAAEPVKLKSGSLRDADSFHKGSGQATIYRAPDGSHLLRLENLSVTNGPDLRVLLSPHQDPKSQGDVKTPGYVELAKLKGNKGNQNYPIPDDVDISAQMSMIIYCKPFHVIFSVAPLQDET